MADILMNTSGPRRMLSGVGTVRGARFARRRLHGVSRLSLSWTMDLFVVCLFWTDYRFWSILC